MKKEIVITATDVLNDKFTRQEMYAIASTFFDRIYNTPEIKRETFIEMNEVKPFCVIETDTAILFPFIGKKIVYDVYKEACEWGGISWEDAKELCLEFQTRQLTIDELCAVRYFAKEIDEIFIKHRCKKFSEVLKCGIWSSSQANHGRVWCCNPWSVSSRTKLHLNYVLPAYSL